MSDKQNPTGEFERIEQAIRECREALAGAGESERESLFARLKGLIRELDLAAPLTVDVSSEASHSEDATIPPSPRLDPLDEATLPPTQDGNVDEETLPPKAGDETATIAPGTTPEGTATGKSLSPSSSFGDYEIISGKISPALLLVIQLSKETWKDSSLAPLAEKETGEISSPSKARSLLSATPRFSPPLNEIVV